MTPATLLTTRTIGEIFVEEITAAGGTVSETFDDGLRLFARSILPMTREVGPKDHIQGGVALRTTEKAIHVHPYLFRQVCRNGAIVARALASRVIDCGDLPEGQQTEAEVATELREAIQACCDEEAFADLNQEVRSAKDMKVDLFLQVLPMLTRLSRDAAGKLMAQIMEEFQTAGDRSLFGAMNAVTAVARETRDPELRWGLEELGGGIGACLRPRRSPDDAARAAALVG
jgi:hypothetical protein